MEMTDALQGRRILVVEDDYLVAQILADILEDAGAEVVGPIGWLDEAIAFLDSGGTALDGAVLDLNLHGEKSYPIADALAARGVRFVFATGYGADAVDDAYRLHPRCQKPFDQHTLVAALTSAG